LPLKHQLTLELSDGTKHVEHKSACGSGSIDRLLKNLEGNTLALQTLADCDQVENASCKPVEFGDDKSVPFAGIIKRRF
jgi:hypothetical protein